MKTTSSTSKKQLKLSKSTSSISGLKREFRNTHPKTVAKLEKRWDFKMLTPVMDTAMSILDNVNPRLKKLARKDEYIIQGGEIEEKIWKLLRTARRLK
jgi:hypothetical protein